MAKINVTKPTGNVEALTLLSAFKTELGTYVIFDSEKMGSMGLPIIYVSKYTTKLEDITVDEEWQSVKNYLKGIINGTNFQYIKIDESLSGSEVFYRALTLPQASFDIIKSRYVVTGEVDSSTSKEALELKPVAIESDNIDNQVNTTILNKGDVVNLSEPVQKETIEVMPKPENVIPVMPNVNPASNMDVQSISIDTKNVENKAEINEAPVISNDTKQVMDFGTDKETFIKACENMFDALVSKYQKKLEELEIREQEIRRKEQEINTKMANASEHLANAEAREQVANIAHDNAQRVMDLSSFMPSNPNINTETGVV